MRVVLSGAVLVIAVIGVLIALVIVRALAVASAVIRYGAAHVRR
jgi:hypothetical protein